MKNERLDRLLDKICHGQTPLGCGQTYAEPAITEQLGRNGFDLIWLDQEHTSCTIEQIRLQIQMSELTGMVSFVRVADHLPSTVKPVLEMAPDGVIFPMVNTRQEAEQVVSACLYPPKGIRGFGPLRANRYGTVPLDEYVRDIDKCFWRIMQIEHIRAVENLEEIIAVEGVSGIVVGPNDLAASIGHLGDTSHPGVTRLMDEIAAICRKNGTIFGVSISGKQEDMIAWKERGVSWIEVGMDYGYIGWGAQHVLDGLRAVFR